MPVPLRPTQAVAAPNIRTCSANPCHGLAGLSARWPPSHTGRRMGWTRRATRCCPGGEITRTWIRDIIPQIHTSTIHNTQYTIHNTHTTYGGGPNKDSSLMLIRTEASSNAQCWFGWSCPDPEPHFHVPSAVAASPSFFTSRHSPRSVFTICACPAAPRFQATWLVPPAHACRVNGYVSLEDVPRHRDAFDLSEIAPLALSHAHA